ncbi:MAG: DUF4416 family protein [Desulfomonilia bacterium]
MAKASIPADVLLFCSMLYNRHAPLEDGISTLREHFGETAFSGEDMPFSYTTYYEKEMGSPLKRRVLAFRRLVPRDSLPEVKHRTNSIEDSFRKDGRRTINLDPGILSRENICLATTKPYSHRIYLRDGIWAEITLMYRGDTYTSLEWTYPDYASKEMIEMFNGIRTMYKEILQCREA